MQDPLTSYPDWIRAVKPHANRIGTTFVPFMGQFESLLQSIELTGFLPSPIENYTASFIDDVYNVFAKRIPQLPRPHKDEGKVCDEFCKALLRFAFYGLATGEKMAMDVALAMLQNSEVAFFSRGDRHQILCVYFLEMGAWGELMDALADKAQSLEVLLSVLSLIAVLKKYVDAFSPEQQFELTIQALQRITNRDLRVCDVNLVVQCFDQYRKCMCDKRRESIELVALVPFIEVIAQFCSSELYHQRSHALSALERYAKDTWMVRSVTEYFGRKGNVDLILNNLRPENFRMDFVKPIGFLLGKIVNNSDNDQGMKTIPLVWKYHEQIHSSEIRGFCDVFTRMIKALRGDKLEKAFTCVMATEPSPEWYLLLVKICRKMMKKLPIGKVYIDRIRSKLIELMLLHDNPFVDNAKRALIEVVGLGANSEDFQNMADILMKEIDSDFKYEVLEKMLLSSKDVKLRPEIYQAILDAAVGRFVESSERTPELCSYIQSICEACHVSLSVAHLERLCSIRQEYAGFFEFIRGLAANGSIDADGMLFITSQISDCEIDMPFFQFFRECFEFLNLDKEAIVSLNLVNEDILWNFALKESPVRSEFQLLLCELFASNNVDEFTDNQVITHFLDEWEKRFCEAENKDIFFDLLRCFVETIEWQADRSPEDPLPHLHWLQPSINVTVTRTDAKKPDIKMVCPYYAMIGNVAAKIAQEAKLKATTVELALFGTTEVLPKCTRIAQYATLGQSVYDCEIEEVGEDVTRSLKLDLIKKQGRRLIPFHLRQELPFRQIMERSWVETIIQCMKEGSYSAYQLLHVLPLTSFTQSYNTLPLGISEILESLPLENPLLLTYNLGTLLAQLSVKDGAAQMMPKDCIEPLAGLIVAGMLKLLGDTNLPVLSDLAHTFVQLFQTEYLWNYPFPAHVIVCLFDVMTSFLLGSFDIVLKKQTMHILSHFFTPGKPKIIFPDHLRERLRLLLMNQDNDLRTCIVNVLDAWSIPSAFFDEIFTDLAELVNTGLMSEASVGSGVLSVVARHLSDFENDSLDQMVNFVLSVFDGASGNFLEGILELVTNMLTLKQLPPESQEMILHALVERFLNNEVCSSDRPAYVEVSKCIAKLHSVRNRDGDLLLLKALEGHHVDRKPILRCLESAVDGDSLSISPTKRVGLKNLGLTCYFNATLQQFFAVTPIRRLVMSYQGDINILKQLKRLFSYLKYVQAKSVDPRFVTEAWMVWENELLDTHKQEDAVEFVQGFVDKYMTAEQDVKDLMAQLCSGITSDHFEGIDTPYHATRNEVFITYPLDVRADITDLSEAFESAAKPEMFITPNQYYASDLNKKIDAKRYSRIKHPPQVLIIQLKRFEYIFMEARRKKLTDFLRISEELDISRFCEEPVENYRLNGIILHKGSAMGGHYISFTRESDQDPDNSQNKWICFDDDVVSYVSFEEVLRQSNGGVLDWAGYILFYERNGPVSIAEPELDMQIRGEIDRINYENILIRRYCSAGYHRLMLELSNLLSGEYLTVCLEYAVDTLPFSKQGQNCEKFFENLAKGLQISSSECKCHYIEYLRTGFLPSCLFLSSIEAVRKGHVALIKIALETEIGTDILSFAKDVYSLVDNCIAASYQQVDQIFEVLLFLYDHYPHVAELAVADGWKDSLTKLLHHDVMAYFEANPAITIEYFFRGCDLTHLLLLATRFKNLPDIGPLQDPTFPRSFLLSKSDINAVADYISCYFSQEQFLKFLNHPPRDQDCVRDISMLRAVTIMFLILKDLPDGEVLEKLLNQEFLIGFGRVAAPSDLSACFAVLAWQNKDFSECILKYHDKWLWQWIFHDHQAVRNNTVAIIANSLRPVEFPKAVKFPEAATDLSLPHITCVEETSPPDVFSCQIVQQLLVGLLNSEPRLQQLIRATDIPNAKKGVSVEMRAEQYLLLVDSLFCFANMNSIPIPNLNALPNLVNLYLTMCEDKKNPFNRQIVLAIEIISKYRIPITFEQAISAFSHSGKSMYPQTVYPSLCAFLPHFVPLSRVPVPGSEFIELFLEQVMFARHQDILRAESSIMSIVSFYLENNCIVSPGTTVRQFFESRISARTKLYGRRNYVMLLMLISKLGVKLDLMDIFVSVCSTQNSLINNDPDLDLNWLVTATFDHCRNHRVDSAEQSVFETLYQNPRLSQQVKDLIKTKYGL